MDRICIHAWLFNPLSQYPSCGCAFSTELTNFFRRKRKLAKSLKSIKHLSKTYSSSLWSIRKWREIRRLSFNWMVTCIKTDQITRVFDECTRWISLSQLKCWVVCFSNWSLTKMNGATEIDIEASTFFSSTFSFRVLLASLNNYK